MTELWNLAFERPTVKNESNIEIDYNINDKLYSRYWTVGINYSLRNLNFSKIWEGFKINELKKTGLNK